MNFSLYTIEVDFLFCFVLFCAVARAKGNDFYTLGFMCRRCILVDILSDLQTLFHIGIFQDV